MIPVVIAENGIGLPVREVEGNAPEMIVAENGLGIPIVLSDLGQPFVVIGAAPFALTITGLSFDSLGAYAQVGNHASIGFTSTCVPSGPDLTGLSLLPDFWVDGVNGNNANAGTSEGAAWATLRHAAETVYGVTKAGRIVVRVKAGTYDTANDYWNTGSTAAANNDGLTIVFESGCIMDGTAANASVNQNGFEFSTLVPWPTIIYGNGLVVQNYVRAGSTPNGVGNRGSHVLDVYNVRATNCDDGFSAHDTSTMRLYDCEGDNCTKAAVTHVNAATVEHYRCKFTGRASATLGVVVTQVGVDALFEDCIFIPQASGQLWQVGTGTLNRCQIGTASARVAVMNTASLTVSDSFVNVSGDTNQTINFQRCYGFMSWRQRNGGSLIVENCVISGPATGISAVFYANFNPGSGSPHLIRNNIFETDTAAAFMSYDATNSGYVVAANSEFFNNVLSGSAAYDADLIAADTGNTVIVGTVTADALIGAANTLDPDDYGYAAGSPAIGAGVGGTNSGFAIGAVAAPAPQIMRP